MSLREDIEALTSAELLDITRAREVFAELKSALNRGEVRAAERDNNGCWKPNQWVKRGILLGFRIGSLADLSPADHSLRFFDKDTYPLRGLTLDHKIRVVPGGSSIRDGSYVAAGVVCMPPMYVNVGAYVDEGTMIDSHALVGSCAQIGKRVHLSAAAQIGGVLEPVGALPVVIEDDVLVGGNCGVYEGTIVRSGAVLAPGTILTGGTPVYDLVKGTSYRRTEDGPLQIPSSAVVVPGSRSVKTAIGHEWGLSLYAPVIVKYRDDKTDRSVQLEDYLR
jgi:2,3,4,5-tetrahydropyridine-2-carboxylate N-succinyltransferase